jgi:aminoglycoside phosphotransferase family enzyme/predicted kinase
MGPTVTDNAGVRASTITSTPYLDIRETHTGIVVLVGDRAYKGKKPITTDFLDFSTAAARERVCAREVELNRRLAPDSYFGVAHLTDPSGGPAEPVVVMRRYADACRLSMMVREGDSAAALLTQIAEKLAEFHAEADRSRGIDTQGTVNAVHARWLANISEFGPFVGSVVSADRIQELRALADRYVVGRSALFTARIEDRRIVDGHGDLLADDIFCPPCGVQILDCLEFDDSLRYVDAIDDVAFLAMDLEYLGAKELADHFLDQYSRLTRDLAPSSLKDFYIAYRAMVRAKVDCIRVSQGHAAAGIDATRHLDLAIAHLRAGAVRVVLVGGGPGTGKTTLARRLAEQFGAEMISTDDVRGELQESGAVGGTRGVLGGGLYSDENVTAVYDTVLRRAQPLLAGGQSVVLDGTWRDPRQRAKAHDLARETQSVMGQILCAASPETAASRVGLRPPGPSDATPEIAVSLAQDQCHWREASVVDTARPLPETIRYAETLWHGMV